MMRIRRKRTSLLLISSAVLMGCPAVQPAPFAPPPDMSAQMAQGCDAQIDQFLGAYCGETTMKDLSKAQMSTPLSQQAVALKGRCASYPVVKAKLSAMDSCVSTIKRGSVAEYDAQQSRLPEAKAKAPEVRADPSYAPLLERWKNLDGDTMVAEENVSRAKREQSANLRRHELRYEDLKVARDKASADLRALFKRHGIEPHDARLVGLW